jgi:asparagine synthase (glutamine-hydrolysing)
MASLLFGPAEGARPLPFATGRGVGAALEEAVLPALRRPPCLVSFSGGRDSSAVLGVATQAARRHGLPDPVPATMRFPDSPETDESAWQRLVLDHLELGGQEIVDLRDELDALGPLATSVLRRDGVRVPPNAYMHVPLLDLARGGSLLTGGGGDELFGTTAARHVLLLRRAARPRPADVRSVAAAALPRPLRAVAWRARNPQHYPWLTPAGLKLVSRALARDEVAWPPRWDRSAAYWYRTRAFAALDGALVAMARERDVMVRNPFLDPGVLAELLVAGGPTGFASRGAAMQELFGELLPPALVTRPTKATFSAAVWGPAARAFAAGWDGAGVDPAHVDVAALRREWLSEEPDYRTLLLLQTAWLDAEAGARPQASASSN